MTYAPSRFSAPNRPFQQFRFFKEAMMNNAKILPKSAFSPIILRLTSTSSIALDASRAKTVAFAQSAPAVLPKQGEELRKALYASLSSSHGRKI